MKVYKQNQNDGKKRKLSRRGVMAIVTSGAFAVATVAIILAITLTGGGGAILPPPDEDGPPVQTGPAFVMPAENFEVGRSFCNQTLVRHRTTGFWETHEGQDFIAPAGTQVRSITDGTILSIDRNTSMYGTVIRVQHHDGRIATFKGLANDVDVEVGQQVRSGAPIGRVGVKPIARLEYDENHFFVSIERDGVRVDPIDYLPELGNK
ncbi:MAG: M23 family metallopeptidase [Firmicutes bacterium]|nr:M23 family metallopeptidase [Bacillota bacterium]